MPNPQYIKKVSTLLFKGNASDFGAYSTLLLDHRELVNHQVYIVSSGTLAAGKYKIRFIPDEDSVVESTVDTGEVLDMTAKDSAYARFVGMLKGIHLEVDTAFTAGETISVVVSSYSKVYPTTQTYLSSQILDSQASNYGSFSATPDKHTGMLYHQLSLSSSGVLAAGAYSVRIIPDVDEVLETSVDIEETLDVTGANSGYVQFDAVMKGVDLQVSTGLTAGEVISIILSSATEQFDTLVLGAIGGTGDHLLLTNIGSNSHVQIDSHIADSTLHFTEASIDHTAIANIGTNSHAAIDTHIADGTLHFTEASIDHTAIANIGTNTHAQIDTHLALTNEHIDWTITGIEVIHADRYTDTVYVHPNHSGDVTSVADGAQTIAANAVTFAKMQDINTNRFIGRDTAGSGDPEELTMPVATAMLNTFTTSLQGLAPSSGGGTTNYLRADGTWAAPPGGSASNSFETQTVTDTDAGYTWAATGSAVAASSTDTLTWVSGVGIDVDVDAALDAIRITTVDGEIVHDNLSGYLAAEHVDWAGAGAGTIHTDNYIENVPTALSTGTVTATTYGITSDSGTDDVVLVEATTTTAGLLGADKWDEIVANTAKVTNATHTGQVTGATALSLDVTAITAQPASGAITSTDTILVNDGGVLSESTFAQLDTYFNSSLSFGTGTVTAVTGGTGLSSTGGTTPEISHDAHTGQVTGATALSLDVTAITAQPASGALVSTDTILTNDGGVLSESTMLQVETYMQGELLHDDFPDFVGNEHIDWTAATQNFETSGSIRSTDLLIDLNNSAAATASTIMNRNSGGGVTLNVNATTGNAQIGQISAAGAAEDIWVAFTRNAAVSLYYNNNIKLATTNTGIDVTGNIVVSGNVDGRDVATDGSTLDAHVADGTIHFTEGSIDHGSIAGLTDDDHTQYLLADGTRNCTGDIIFETDVDVGGAATQDNGSRLKTFGGTLGDLLNDNTPIMQQEVTLGDGTEVLRRTWVWRDAAGSTWAGTRFHTGHSVDAADTTPGTDTRGWYEVDIAAGSQHWGDTNNEFMTLDFGGDLSVIGDFACVGLTTNCTAVNVTIGNDDMLLGDGTTHERYHVGMQNPSGDGFLSIGGDESYLLGTSILFPSSSYTSITGDLIMYSGAARILDYDLSVSLWDFKANHIQTTGDIDVGGFTSTGIDASTATATQLTIADATSIFGNPVRWANDGLTEKIAFGPYALDLTTPAIIFSSADRMTYDRTTDTYSFIVGSLPILDFNSSSLTYGASSGTAYTFAGNSSNSAVTFSSGSNAVNGSNFVGYGGSHASAGNWLFRSGSTTTLDYSSATWDFQANDILTTGDVGIGAAVPDAPLHIQHNAFDIAFTASVQTPIIVSGQSAQNCFGQVLVDSTKNGGWRIGTATNATLVQMAYVDSDPRFDINVTSNGTATASTIATFKSTGLGIATIDPTETLHVEGLHTDKIYLESTDSGQATIAKDHGGLHLTAHGMNGTSKFTPAVMWGTTDPNVTAANAENLANICGYATEAYSAAASGGMGLQFSTTPNLGSASAPVSRMTIDQDGDVDVLTGTVTADAFIAPYAHYQVSTATDHGGANGTVVAAVWDGTELHEDTEFTHSTVTNASRVTVGTTGRYHLKGVISCTNGGLNRQTLTTRYRIDGGTWVTLAAQQSYSRGSTYNSVIRAPFDFEAEITASSYVEIGTIVEDTDASTTALATTDSSFIIRRIG